MRIVAHGTFTYGHWTVQELGLFHAAMAGAAEPGHRVRGQEGLVTAAVRIMALHAVAILKDLVHMGPIL